MPVFAKEIQLWEEICMVGIDSCGYGVEKSHNLPPTSWKMRTAGRGKAYELGAVGSA